MPPKTSPVYNTRGDFKISEEMKNKVSETNKIEKEHKREIKENNRNNKELLENANKLNQENTERIEEKLNGITKVFTDEMRNSMTTLAIIAEKMVEAVNKMNESPAGRKESNEVQPRENTEEESTPEDNTNANNRIEEPVTEKEQTLAPSRGELYEMIKSQQVQIDYLMQKNNDKEKMDKIPDHLKFQPGGSAITRTYAKIVAIPTDLEGNTNENVSNTEHPQSTDFIQVKPARKRKAPRENLSNTMLGAVDNKLMEHREQTKDDYQKPEKEMTPDSRMETIKKMLTKSSSTVGIAPLTKASLDRAHENMIKRGVISTKEPYNLRMQKVIKSIVLSWTRTYLKMPKEAWNDIEVIEITQPVAEEADIIFIRCKSIEDAAKINIFARNLPQDFSPTAPRLVMHIDPRARTRYHAFCAMAKAIRDHSDGEVQTSVRTGRTDYLLRKRSKGDNTPWGKIPPIKINQEMPAFQIGLYKELYQPKSRNDEPEKENDDEEMDILENNIREMENNKRERSNNEDEQNCSKYPKASDPLAISNTDDESSAADSESENEDESKKANAKSFLNSTPIPKRNQNETHYPKMDTIDETPANKKKLVQKPTNKLVQSIPDTPENNQAPTPRITSQTKNE